MEIIVDTMLKFITEITKIFYKKITLHVHRSEMTRIKDHIY